MVQIRLNKQKMLMASCSHLYGMYIFCSLQGYSDRDANYYYYYTYTSHIVSLKLKLN